MNIQLALDEQPWNVAVTIKLLCLAPSNVNGYLAAKIIGKGSLVQYSIRTYRMYPAVPIKELTLLVNTAIIGSCDCISKHGFDWSA